MVEHQDIAGLLNRAISKVGGSATLRLTAGTDLTGTINAVDQRIITITVSSTVWTVPVSSVLAVGATA